MAIQLNRIRSALSVILSIMLIVSNIYTPVFSTGLNTVPKLEKANLQHFKRETNNKIIVKYKDEKKSSIVKESISRKLNNYKINVEKKLSKIEVIGVSDKAEFAFILQELKNNPNVEYAQPDYRLKKFEVPTDELFGKQWGLYNAGQIIAGKSGTYGMDINACTAWDTSKGNEDVIVECLIQG
jgi:hypothetical protein